MITETWPSAEDISYLNLKFEPVTPHMARPVTKHNKFPTLLPEIKEKENKVSLNKNEKYCLLRPPS